MSLAHQPKSPPGPRAAKAAQQKDFAGWKPTQVRIWSSESGERWERHFRPVNAAGRQIGRRLGPDGKVSDFKSDKWL